MIEKIIHGKCADVLGERVCGRKDIPCRDPFHSTLSNRHHQDSIASRRETLRIEAASEANCMRVSSLTDMA